MEYKNTPIEMYQLLNIYPYLDLIKQFIGQLIMCTPKSLRANNLSLIIHAKN